MTRDLTRDILASVQRGLQLMTINIEDRLPRFGCFENVIVSPAVMSIIGNLLFHQTLSVLSEFRLCECDQIDRFGSRKG